MFYDSQDKIDDAASELCLMRTILERLECSFASQEAKLDKLLGMMSKLLQPKFSSPDATVSHAMSITPTAVATSLQLRQLRSPETTISPNGTMSDGDQLLDTVLYQEENEFTGIKRIITKISISFLNTNSDNSIPT